MAGVWRGWLLGVLLCGGSVLGADGVALETGDGLALEFTPAGVVETLTIDGLRLPTNLTTHGGTPQRIHP